MLLKIKERAYGCDLISEAMLSSLAYEKTYNSQLPLANMGKVVVINENGHVPSIVSSLNKKQSNSKFVDYAQINIGDKENSRVVNVYECSSDFSEMFLSERNLVVVTFRGEDESAIVSSVMERLLKVVNKNILPCSVMILGLGGYDMEAMERISEKVLKSIDELERNVEAELKSVLNDYDALKDNQFFVKVNLSRQMNLKEQLGFIKEIINFSAMDIDVMVLLENVEL